MPNRASSPSSTTPQQQQQQQRRRRLRRRAVRFGNPAQKGIVFTVESYDNDDDDDGRATNVPFDDDDDARRSCAAEERARCERVVAMVNVPPEQLYEELLDFTRSHLCHVRHVRILMTSNDDDDDDDDDDDEARSCEERRAKNDDDGDDDDNDEDDEKDENDDEEGSSYVPRVEETKESLATTTENNDGESATSEEGEPRSRREDEPFQQSESRPQHLVVPPPLSPPLLPQQTYLVLLEMDSKQSVDDLISDLHMKPFIFLQDDVLCRAYRVAAPLIGGERRGTSLIGPFFGSGNVVGTTTNIDPPTLHSGSSQQQELSGGGGPKHSKKNGHGNRKPETQNCAVCLELLNYSPSTVNNNNDNDERPALLTTVCNHTFHVDCLRRWQDSPCPVCRYDHSGFAERLSACHVCGLTSQCLVCLVCGVVSCVDHARVHHRNTSHAYALDTDTRRVWDFCGDGLVHRLVLIDENEETGTGTGTGMDTTTRTTVTGKMVEVTDPSNTFSNMRPADVDEEEATHRKLEALAAEYRDLLAEQLRAQRSHHAARLREARRELRRPAADGGGGAAEVAASLRRERHRLEQRCASLREKHDTAARETSVLAAVTESLEANKIAVEREIRQVETERREARGMVDEILPRLEKKVESLMLQLETGCDSGGGGGVVKEEDDRKPAARRK